jgi:hypothetical protein
MLERHGGDRVRKRKGVFEVCLYGPTASDKEGSESTGGKLRFQVNQLHVYLLLKRDLHEAIPDLRYVNC